MTLDDLTVNFFHLDRDELLSDWGWLLPASLKPILVTAIGNAFVQDEFSTAVYLLDVGSADLICVADSEEQFNAELGQRDFVMRFFDVPLVARLRSVSPLLAGSLYSFKKLPTLGGAYDLENFEPTDIEVHFSICGQMQGKIRTLPPGMSVDRVTVG